MDPNNLPNSLNGLGGSQNPNFVQNNQFPGQNLMGNAANQYNPMLLQQQYLNFGGFNMPYNNQVQGVPLEPTNRIFQPEIPQIVPTQSRQTSQQNAQHQKLFEEQCRQIELERKKAAERQRQSELAEQARLREIQERQEREREELLRRQEEEARLAEEQRRKEEAERIEKEKLLRIAEEEKRKAAEAAKLRSGMEARHSNLGQPLTLVATHFLPTFLNMIPFPYEGMTGSTTPLVSDLNLDRLLLENCDPHTVATIADVLSQVDVDDITSRLDKLRPNEKENNDLFFDQLPPLIRAVVSHSTSALDVDSHNDMQLLDNEDLMMQEDITRSGPSQVLMQQSDSYRAQMQAANNQNQHNQNNQYSSHENTPTTSATYSEGTSGTISIEKRRQMMSVGKAPKAGGGSQRKKKDMVESLYDSLTDNFVPSVSRRGRRRNRENSEDDDESLKRDLELIAAMEAGEKLPATVTGFRRSGYDSDEENKFFEKKNKKRKREEQPDRPPTPTEVISARAEEWKERQRQKIEMNKKRKTEDDGNDWNTDALAENDSFVRFNMLLDTIFEQIENFDMSQITQKKKRKSLNTSDETGNSSSDEEDDGVSSDLLIDRGILDELRREAMKLKRWQKLHKVSPDRLIKIVSLLESNIRDVISNDNLRLLVPILDDEIEEDELALKEVVEERLLKASDAACCALLIMTSHKMHKQVLLEDTIERAVALAKLYLTNIIFPASDSIYKSASGNKKKTMTDEPKKRKKVNTSRNRSPIIQQIYLRVTELFGCFAELVRLDTIPDSSIHNMASMSVSSFFVSNVGELQIQSMRLASNIFSRGDHQIRLSMMSDILSSLHRIPTTSVKNVNNGYRLGNDQWISNTTALVMQLIQSVIKMPKYKKTDDDNDNGQRQINQDAVVRDSFLQASKITNGFLSGFLKKCSQKGSKLDGEEDYRILFSHFLQEILLALYQPEWPVAEMIIASAGALLVQHFKSKNTDITIRQASLDFLGLVTARLRKESKEVAEDAFERLELVVKTLIYEEDDDGYYDTVDDVDVSKLSQTDRLKKLEQALIDYLIEKKGDSEVSYAVLYYTGEWYRDTAEDLEMSKNKTARALSQPDLTEKERKKIEKKRERMLEKGQLLKEFLMKLVDKKNMRKRAEFLKYDRAIMLESDALWAVKFLARNREFSHSFDNFLKHIVHGAGSETVVNLRTRALKSLSMIIEADHEVLILEEVRAAVHSRMIDSHAQVREAAIELLGKFLLVKRDYIDQYYSMLTERILDSGVAVRKRVIRIMREICEKFPTYEKIPEMLSKMVRRINDEEGVKKLIQETFSTLWFQPVDDRIQPDVLANKALVMSSVVRHCIQDVTVEYLEQLIHWVLKSEDKMVLLASRQLVDKLVDHILHLETTMAQNQPTIAPNSGEAEELVVAAKQKANQESQLACLTTLAIFSKVRPELMVKHAETLQPYLTTTSNSAKTAAENAVLNEVIGMLERVVPLMSHPSDGFLNGIDEDLTNMATTCGMQLVVSTISCSSAIWNRFKRIRPKLVDKFLANIACVTAHKRIHERDPTHKTDKRTESTLQRSIFTIGVLCRYFDLDQMLSPDKPSEEPHDELNPPPEKRAIRDKVFECLEFFSRSNHPMLRQKALSSLGHFCSQHSEYLTRPAVQQMYLANLSDKIPGKLPQKIQVLKNLEMFLQNEEKKLIKKNEEWNSNKASENLKEMELSGSGLGSTVIQRYWSAVLNSYCDPDINVRMAAVQVAWLTLNQGLVTPGASISYLIAMTTDPVELIRNKIDNLIKEIDSKYAGMVQSKAILGVRLSFKLHQKIHQAAVAAGNEDARIVRGIRWCDFSAGPATRTQFSLPRMSNDGMALLSGLYQSLRTNRQQRRSFLQSVLKLFADDCREKLSLEEWIFVADNVATFPYQMIDEPLYVIRLIDQIVAQTGQSILMQFKQSLLPLPEYEGRIEDEDVLFDPENLFRRFPSNKDHLYDLMRSSQSCFILLYIRSFLIKLYSFTDAKVQEYLPSEAAKVYEKAVSRKNIHTFSPATALLELNPEKLKQRNTMEGDVELAKNINKFRTMLLTLDRGDDDDDGEAKIQAIANNDYDDDDLEEVDEMASVGSAAPIMDE
ncbi:unnamed protein product [Caenorhabditis bovis]|uniref:Nipped-B protein n=1 Tax=Caenorhabditis bovis TaxID=2654633 RepID=A0A8S1EXV1_9PELO|nr:unnamed protein product [Caenorhabditis bovis]